MSAAECECWMTPPETWLSAASCGYGGGYEPGSQWEWNPECPAHPPDRPEETTDLRARLTEALAWMGPDNQQAVDDCLRVLAEEDA